MSGSFTVDESEYITHTDSFPPQIVLAGVLRLRCIKFTPPRKDTGRGRRGSLCLKMDLEFNLYEFRTGSKLEELKDQRYLLER